MTKKNQDPTYKVIWIALICIWSDTLYILQLKNKETVFSNETALYLHGLMVYAKLLGVERKIREYSEVML